MKVAGTKFLAAFIIISLIIAVICMLHYIIKADAGTRRKFTANHKLPV